MPKAVQRCRKKGKEGKVTLGSRKQKLSFILPNEDPKVQALRRIRTLQYLGFSPCVPFVFSHFLPPFLLLCHLTTDAGSPVLNYFKPYLKHSFSFSFIYLHEVSGQLRILPAWNIAFTSGNTLVYLKDICPSGLEEFLFLSMGILD